MKIRRLEAIGTSNALLADTAKKNQQTQTAEESGVPIEESFQSQERKPREEAFRSSAPDSRSLGFYKNVETEMKGIIENL